MEATTQVIETTVQHTHQGEFVEVPFTVPEGITKLEIHVHVSALADEPCTIDVGLCDPTRVRGWSGGTKYSLIVAEDEATPGYVRGPIQPGRWAVLLGAYIVGAEGVVVTTEVTLVPTCEQWFKGDLHVHTVHSDGTYTMAELDLIARRNGLDFIGLTDHNTVTQNYSYPRETPVTYIPGMELTTYRGHANFFGVEEPCDDFRAFSSEDVRHMMGQARERGARIAINHPFDDAGPSCQWQWGYELPFEWLEVWNGPWREANEQTLTLWQAMLSEGRRVIAVGGSDTHREHPYVKHGYPTNHVLSKSKNTPDILGAIGLGHVTLSFSPDGPRLEIECSDGWMGGESADDSATVVIRGAEAGDECVVVTEAGAIERYTVTSSGDSEHRITHHAEKFVRAELWRYFPQVQRQLMAAMSNPIFMKARCSASE